MECNNVFDIGAGQKVLFNININLMKHFVLIQLRLVGAQAKYILKVITLLYYYAGFKADMDDMLY